jgi:hypothetical protein
MKKVRSVPSIRDPYSQRILSNVIGKDPLKVLAATPGRIKRLLSGLSTRQLQTPPARGKWSIAQIVGHLADAELVLGFRLRMAIAQSGSPLQAMDQNKWEKRLGYRDADVARKLRLLTVVREEHVALLRSLPPRALKRYGMHEERGKETVERMAQLYAGHDINHVRQIAVIRKVVERNG